MQVRFLRKKQELARGYWSVFVIVTRQYNHTSVVVLRNFMYTCSSEGAIRRVTPVEEYQRWRRLEPAVGCKFARVISINPSRYGQIFEIVPNAATLPRVAENVAARVNALVENKFVSAAALLFPYLKTLEDTARVMLGLGNQPLWTVTPTEIENEIVGKMVAIRVVRAIPFGKKTCNSESLVLGPFGDFPPTRRSPITAMEIYVGDPLEFDPKTGAPTKQANLAHIIRREAYGEKPYDTVWQDSIDGREASLGTKDDNRAKAKVTLVVPIPLARRLGCAP